MDAHAASMGPQAEKGRPVRRASFLRARWAALWLVALLPACGGGSSPASASRALLELERLMFVPAAASRLEGYVGPYADCSLESSLVVDRFEFTRGDWLFYDTEGAQESAANFGSSPLTLLAGPALDMPAFLSYGQAVELAEARGMRLLTSREWLHLAVGGRSLVYPYGKVPHASWANTLELGLGAPTPVGTFESGKSHRYDCYDLLGNVWEWVDGVALGYSDFPTESQWEELDGDQLASVMGGGYDSRSMRSFGRAPLRLHAMLLDRETVRPSIGARMCAEAEEYLLNKAADWGTDDASRSRIEAVGRRWASNLGRQAVQPFLAELAERPGAPEAVSWLARAAGGERGSAAAGR